MSRVIDFDRNARFYDRRHGERLPGSHLDQLVDAASIVAPTTILDLAAGTGRTAIPFADRGFRVLAMDRSSEMLAALRGKSVDGQATAVRGDATHLPFARHSVDVVVIARLLYLVPEWQSVIQEALRVLRRPGLVLHEWANGSPDEPWVRIRERVRSFFQERGISEPFHPGARTEAEIDAHLVKLGATRTRVNFGASSVTMAPGDFVRRTFEGEFSYTWDIPVPLVEECRRAVVPWASETFDALDEPLPFPRQISWSIYRV